MSIWDSLLGKQETKSDYIESLYGHKVIGVSTQTIGTNPYANGLAAGETLDDAMRLASALQQMQPKERKLPTLTLSALSGEAGRASLEELRDLWRARWGDKWVKREEIDGDFFEVAAVRLLSSNRLETHSLGDGITVYRLL